MKASGVGRTRCSKGGKKKQKKQKNTEKIGLRRAGGKTSKEERAAGKRDDRERIALAVWRWPQVIVLRE